MKITTHKRNGVFKDFCSSEAASTTSDKTFYGLLCRKNVIGHGRYVTDIDKDVTCKMCLKQILLKKVNLPKKDAGRKLATRLKDLGKQQPPKDIVNNISDKVNR